MSWEGELVFGPSWAIYRGQAADNTPHAHAAIQIVFGDNGDVAIASADGIEWTGPGFAIRPLVEHSLAPTGEVALLYIEPQSPLAFYVADAIGDVDIASIDPAILAFKPGQPGVIWNKNLETLVPVNKAAIDERLLAALELLAKEPGSRSIGDTALACNLSESRLRTLARGQLGLPLSTWLIWRKLERATRTLHEGTTLSDAAAAGGFADQAHFARAMRRMFGITPRTAQRAASNRRG
nr:AraC family transcriptional regulator [uncultured Sphingorhabdus sp.]